jgi:hypothetical protein
VASETRSSTSTTATLKDFVLGQFGNCTATMTTAASSQGTVAPGTEVTDTATIVGSNPAQDPSGTVTFFLCSGVAAGGDCATGGTNIGTGSLVGNFAGTSTATSPAVNTAASNLAPGHYCFRAEWPGDLNYVQAGGFSHTDSTTECFTVQDTSSITSAQVWRPNDSATITSANGTALSGTLDFKMYSGSSCSGTVLYDEPDITLTAATSPATRSTSNGTVPATTVEFHEADSPVTVSWRSVFTSTSSGVAGSTGPCETSTVTIDDTP